jgi:DNA-3-methyladenine glycosylase
MADRLDRAFFARAAPEVARALVGKLLARPDEGLVARIVEVEAYMQHDPACHAHNRRTPRLEPLYGPPGHAYVYFTYGMHWCLNTATGSEGSAEGCLIRAAEPIEGLERMRERRGGIVDRDLLRGPARLAQAFDLDGSWSGRDLCAVDAPLHLADDGHRVEVATGPRVGVSRAADWPWRFLDPTSRFVSPYSRSPRAPRPGAVQESGPLSGELSRRGEPHQPG